MGFVDSLTGNIEKAKLLIIDKESFMEAKRKNGLLKKGSIAEKSGSGNSMGKNESSKSFDTAISDKKTRSMDIKVKEFTVMFNPTEINLQGRAGGSVPRRDYNSQSSTMDMGESPLYINFNTRLIFDRVVPGDAFTGVTSTSMSSIIGRGASLISSAMSGGDNDPGNPSREVKKNKYVLDPHSVRGEVEALIGAIRNPDTRLLCFTWGEAMEYTGFLNNVTVEYAMFNTNGEPVRAFVDLSITIADEKNEDLVLLTANLWNQRFKSAFKDDISYVNAGQKAGSILGLS